MAIVINGSGTVTGLSVGGLPDGTVDSDTLATDSVTAAKIPASLENTFVSGRKNLIINGDMRIDQRNGTSTINATGVTYNVDRWLGRGVSSAGVFTLAQDTTSPANFTNSLKATVTTADSSIASGSSYRVQHMIEGYNVANLNWGTSDAQSVTLSFWVRSSVTGTFGGSVANGDFNRFNPFSYTISSANTWEYKTVTIAGDTTGTWTSNNALGLRLNFSLGAGSSKIGTVGTWTSSSLEGATGQTNLIATNSATFYITGVQLEVGSTATDFEHRSYGEELALCQRYYWQDSAAKDRIGILDGSTANYPSIFPVCPVPMRTLPTGTFLTIGTFYYNNSGSASFTPSGGTVNVAQEGNEIRIRLNAVSNGVGGSHSMKTGQWNTQIKLDAEL